MAGVIAGEIVARAAGVHSIEGHVILDGIGLAGGLWPDIDCGSSTVTRALGPVGWAASHLLRGMSHALYLVTKGRRDEDCEGEHRHMSHTVLFAAVSGLVLVAAVWAWAGALPLSPWLLGAALTAGCLSHCLTDSATVAGCPFLFPLPIAGETWYEIRVLGPLSFHTGSSVETRAVRPLLVVAAVLLIPGVVPFLLSTWHQVHAPSGASGTVR